MLCHNRRSFDRVILQHFGTVIAGRWRWLAIIKDGIKAVHQRFARVGTPPLRQFGQGQLIHLSRDHNTYGHAFGNLIAEGMALGFFVHVKEGLDDVLFILLGQCAIRHIRPQLKPLPQIATLHDLFKTTRGRLNAIRL